MNENGITKWPVVTSGQSLAGKTYTQSPKCAKKAKLKTISKSYPDVLPVRSESSQ